MKYHFIGIQATSDSNIKSGFTITLNDEQTCHEILDYYNKHSSIYECYLMKSITKEEFERFHISAENAEKILNYYLNGENNKISITDKLKLSYLVHSNSIGWR